MLGYALPGYFDLVMGSISLYSLLKSKEDIDMNTNLISAMLATVAMDGYQVILRDAFYK